MISHLLRSIRQQPLGALALFVALGGTSYAVTVPANSIRAKQLAPNSVGPSETSRNSVGTSEVRNFSLLADDFRRGQLPAGPQGPQGVQGPPGRDGTNGANGANGATKIVARRGRDLVATPDNIDTVRVGCAAGETVVAGGWNLQAGVRADVRVVQNGPFDEGPPTGWTVEVRNDDTNNDNADNITIRTIAMCASP